MSSGSRFISERINRYVSVLQKKEEPQQYKISPKKQSQSVNDLLGLGKLLTLSININV